MRTTPSELQETFRPDPNSAQTGPMVYRHASNHRLEWVATVVNPKTMRPYFMYRAARRMGVLAVPSDGTEVVIIGNGYLENDEDSPACCPDLDLPRVHCPFGVAFQGEGLGTCLYVGMAALATYLHRLVSQTSHAVAFSGEGVCSNPSMRKPPSTSWWEKAYKSGLAEGYRDGVYSMLFKHCAQDGLVLDVAPGLQKVFDDYTQNVNLAKAVLNLDLVEVEEPHVVRYFYALAVNVGADYASLKKFRNRTESARSRVVVKPRDYDEVAPDASPSITEIEGDMKTHDVWTRPEEGEAIRRNGRTRSNMLARLMREPVLRPNPPPDYEQIAADLYPDLAGLDD